MCQSLQLHAADGGGERATGCSRAPEGSNAFQVDSSHPWWSRGAGAASGKWLLAHTAIILLLGSVQPCSLAEMVLQLVSPQHHPQHHEQPCMAPSTGCEGASAGGVQDAATECALLIGQEGTCCRFGQHISAGKLQAQAASRCCRQHCNEGHPGCHCCRSISSPGLCTQAHANAASHELQATPHPQTSGRNRRSSSSCSARFLLQAVQPPCWQRHTCCAQPDALSSRRNTCCPARQVPAAQPDRSLLLSQAGLCCRGDGGGLQASSGLRRRQQ